MKTIVCKVWRNIAYAFKQRTVGVENIKQVEDRKQEQQEDWSISA